MSFYKELYASRVNGTNDYESGGMTEAIDHFTMNELREVIKILKNGKCKDAVGICAEMVKDGCEELWVCILDLFNDVLGGRLPPDDWRRTKLIVIFKKGDPLLPQNYRPIAILPILYKIFSRLLCNRVSGIVIPGQSCEQAAYRKGFCTEDHLLTLTLLTEKCLEWNHPLWLGLVDFEKAFDTVEHAALWETLAKQHVPDHYVNILATLYTNQTAYVYTETESKEFPVLTKTSMRIRDPMHTLQQ